MDFDEFYKGIRDYGLKISEQEAKAAFQTIDRDKTGSINFDEFLEALRVSTREKSTVAYTSNVRVGFS